MNRPVIILGGGGHSNVCWDLLLQLSARVIGIAMPDETATEINGIPVIGNDNDVLRYLPESVYLVNGLGSIGSANLRKRVFDFFHERGYQFATIIHPSAVIANNVHIEQGVQIMAGSIIQTGTSIGVNTIINTKASIDHDCIIGPHAHISPGATLCGSVEIGSEVHIGAGTTVIQGVHINRNSLVGAGSLVIKNVAVGQKVYGVPAKEVLE